MFGNTFKRLFNILEIMCSLLPFLYAYLYARKSNCKMKNLKKQTHKIHQRQNFGSHGSVQTQWYPYLELFFKKNIISEE